MKKIFSIIVLLCNLGIIQAQDNIRQSESQVLLSSSEANVSTGKETMSVQVLANGEYTAKTNVQWLTLRKNKGRLMMTTQPNTDGERRKAIVTVNQGTASSTFTLNQLGQWDGEDYTSATLQTHAVKLQVPTEATNLFSVSVNGHYTALYNDYNYWKGLVHFGNFEFEDGQEVTVDITYSSAIKSYELLPRTLDLKSVEKISDNTVRVVLNKADQKMTFIPNGTPKKNALHLFANSIDKNAPIVPTGTGFLKDDSRKLYYFGPGYYKMKDVVSSETLQLHNGWSLYIAAGAVVYGNVNLWGVQKGTKIGGRGLVYNDDANKAVILSISSSDGVEVEGLTFHCHRVQCWQTALSRCTNLTMNNINVVGTRYACTDGIDVQSCQNCNFNNMFLRSSDDAVSIKCNYSRKDNVPANTPACENLTFENMQLWNDCNNAFTLGAETNSPYKNIKLRNSAVLFSYDDCTNHLKLDERGAMSICSLYGTWFTDITFENIDVYHCERLIALGYQATFWFGSMKGDQSTEGGIKNVTFKNINSYNNSKSTIANDIHLYGWQKEGTPDKYVDGVTFDNVVIEGTKLTSLDDAHFTIGPLVKNIIFK